MSAGNFKQAVYWLIGELARKEREGDTEAAALLKHWDELRGTDWPENMK